MSLQRRRRGGLGKGGASGRLKGGSAAAVVGRGRADASIFEKSSSATEMAAAKRAGESGRLCGVSNSAIKHCQIDK